MRSAGRGLRSDDAQSSSMPSLPSRLCLVSPSSASLPRTRSGHLGAKRKAAKPSILGRASTLHRSLSLGPARLSRSCRVRAQPSA